MKEIFKSAVHMLIMDNNKVLLQKRKGSKLWPGYYALPAGHINEGENQYDALIREAKEELDIEIDLKNIINSYVVLRRNFFEIDGKKLEPYIDYYFEISKYKDSNVKLSIRLPESIDNTLRRIATVENMSFNNVLVSCIKYALDNTDLTKYEEEEK